MTFDRDPKAFKVVPLSQVGGKGPLQPVRSNPTTEVAGLAGQASKRLTPIEEATLIVQRERERKAAKERRLREEEAAARREKEILEKEAKAREEQRLAKQEEAAREAEKERVRKLEELQRWREEEAARIIREAEEKKRREEEEKVLAKQRAEEEKKRLEQKKRRREYREQEEQRQKDEDEAWEKFKREAAEAENARRQDVPAWAALGARCAWFSQTVQQFLPVSITAMDLEAGVVKVTFDHDPNAYKEVPVSVMGENGLLQPFSVLKAQGRSA